MDVINRTKGCCGFHAIRSVSDFVIYSLSTGIMIWIFGILMRKPGQYLRQCDSPIQRVQYLVGVCDVSLGANDTNIPQITSKKAAWT